MYFKTIEELNLWLRCYKNCILDGGSQGICYKIGNKVYKIFIQFIDKDYDEVITYEKDSILQFSTVANGTYIWPIDTIVVGDVVVGYITNYVKAKPLYKTNPLIIGLDRFEVCLEEAMKDVKIISDSGILTFDVAYNILYGRCGLKVIDTLEYSKTDIDSERLYVENRSRFNYEVMLFLIDGYFDEFIENNVLLYNMFNDRDVDLIEFLREFRKRLSETTGHEILKLGEAKKSMVIKKSRNPKYIRELYQ